MIIFLIVFIQFFEQLLFQMSSRCFFDRAPFSHYRFFLCLAFSSRSALCGTWQVRNLWSQRTDFSFLRFYVRIHQDTLALLIRDKKNGNSSELKND
jgi:hypothetical protein